MSLSNKEIKFLKKRAHRMKPIFQIGKHGVNEENLSEIKEAIEKRELIKIQILQNAPQSINEIATSIEEFSDIHIVQKIGRVLVLYQSSSNENNRNISNQVRALKNK